MINAARLGPNAVQVTGLDVDLMPPAMWRPVLERYAMALQRSIATFYDLERTGTGRPFLPNSVKWTLMKQRRGLSTDKGKYLKRIIRTLRTRELYTISTVTPAGSAVITLSEEYLYSLVPHARYYARQKVIGGRIIQLGAGTVREQAHLWLGSAYDSALTRQERAAARRDGEKPERRHSSLRPQDRAAMGEMQGASFDAIQRERAKLALQDLEGTATTKFNSLGKVTDFYRFPKVQSKKHTLAQTAWRAARKTAARLRRFY